MCGIAGLIDSSQKSDLNFLTNNMISKLSHRGPDHQGVWVNNDNNVSLANSRLAIQDLTKNGNQPFVSPSGNFILVMNGEIYNHNFLRSKIFNEKGFNNWKSNSDTETVSCLFDFYSFYDIFNMLEGMFALAIYDKKNDKLILARDKVGEKPVYYGKKHNFFFFSSEIKAILSTDIIQKKISSSSLYEYLKLKNIPGPNSIFKDIYKLLPGFFLSIDTKDLNYKLIKYWNLKDIISNNLLDDKLFFSESQILSETKNILKKSIKKQLISDKPVGCFLSGGVDSSLVASLMSEINERKINTFTIGFDNNIFNEAEVAKKISKYINTSHHEYYFNEKEILNLVEILPNVYDEPFSDSSQLPTMIISNFAKKHVSVALTGDGGDELFCGYNRYIFVIKYWPKLSYLNPRIKSLFLTLINNFPLKIFNNFLNNLIKNKIDFENLIKKIKLAFESNNLEELYLKLISDFNNVDIMSYAKKKDLKNFYKKIEDINLLPHQEFMYNDFINYFPNDIMTKVDRASMHYSLETRAPFMDSEVINSAWKFSTSYTRKKESKWILKKLLENYIPKQLIYRPKKGFSVPLNDWLRGPLKNWMIELLEENNLNDENFFDQNTINYMLKSHLNKKHNFGNELWSICIFQQWRKYYGV